MIAVRIESGSPVFVRLLFQGKLNGDVRVSGGQVRTSRRCRRARGERMRSNAARRRSRLSRLHFDAAKIRQKPEAPFRESARAVDLTAAEIIVSVGRGIKEKENIPVVEELAKVMGAIRMRNQ